MIEIKKKKGIKGCFTRVQEAARMEKMLLKL